MNLRILPGRLGCSTGDGFFSTCGAPSSRNPSALRKLASAIGHPQKLGQHHQLDSCAHNCPTCADKQGSTGTCTLDTTSRHFCRTRGGIPFVCSNDAHAADHLPWIWKRLLFETESKILRFFTIGILLGRSPLRIRKVGSPKAPSPSVDNSRRSSAMRARNRKMSNSTCFDKVFASLLRLCLSTWEQWDSGAGSPSPTWQPCASSGEFLPRAPSCLLVRCQLWALWRWKEWGNFQVLEDTNLSMMMLSNADALVACVIVDSAWHLADTAAMSTKKRHHGKARKRKFLLRTRSHLHLDVLFVLTGCCKHTLGWTPHMQVCLFTPKDLWEVNLYLGNTPHTHLMKSTF